MPSIACSEPVLVHLRNTARAQTLAHISRKFILSLSTMEDSSCLIAGRSEVQVDQPFTHGSHKVRLECVNSNWSA